MSLSRGISIPRGVTRGIADVVRSQQPGLLSENTEY